MRTFLRSKIHRATVTEADVDYVGSISIDEDIMDAAGILEYEQVHVVGLTGGGRVITYAIKAPRGSGTIGLNGAAALLIVKGELCIVFQYDTITNDEIASFKPRVLLMGEHNRIDKIVDGEIHGQKL